MLHGWRQFRPEWVTGASGGARAPGLIHTPESRYIKTPPSCGRPAIWGQEPREVGANAADGPRCEGHAFTFAQLDDVSPGIRPAVAHPARIDSLEQRPRHARFGT